MFSGIIEKTAIAQKIEKGNDIMRFYLPVPEGWKLTPGESISIDGICSTVEKLSDGSFCVYYMPETIRKTHLNNTDGSHVFNLEKCLTLQTLIGGHLVSGHIDTTATVEKIEEEGESKVLTFKLKPGFTKYIIYKGSVAVNGVSLTIVEVRQDSFTISLIPHTLTHTNLGQLQIGDTVNIEVDMIAKYLEKLQEK
ncbi:MAG: riboflavin synthase [Candidatus Levyibacteriota bacterium]